jgi:surface polysaccharide O-acyltransferase-like enzyme
VAALATLFLWMGFTSLTLEGPAPIAIEIASDVSFVVACAGGCCCLIAASLRFGLRPSRALTSLSTNAYSLYLVHYVFIVWMQFALLPLPLLAVVKAPIVFMVTLALSWVIILAVQRIPFGMWLVGATPTRPATPAAS